MLKTKSKNKYWMKYAGALAAIFFAVFVFFASSASAAPDATIYYQGKLTNTSDVAVADASYNFKFRIYDASSGGTCLWSARGTCGTPTAKSVTVSKGIFSTELGDGSDNALNLDFNSNYWLEVTVGNDSPMNVRKKINAAGYSLNSLKLGGKAETDFALLAGRAGGQTLIGGTASGDDLTFQTTSNGSKGSYIFSELGSGLVLSTSGTLSAVANTLHTQNTDTGTTGVSFIVGSGTDSATTNTTLQFGNTNSETFYFDGATTDNFKLSDDLDIAGGLTTTSTINGQTISATASFTGTVAVTTSLTSPIVIGGTGTTDDLILRTTSGNGASGADMIFQTGNNGATEAMRILYNGNVGVGTATPGYKLHVAGSANDYLSYAYNTNTGASAGGLYIRTDGTGNLLTLNASGTDILTVSEAATTINNPVSLLGTGDVTIANDIIMSNSTAGNIKFQGPGYITTDSSWQNLDLTLSAANTGFVIVNDTFQENLTSIATTAGTEYGIYQEVSDTGIVTTGTDTTYGLYQTLARTGATNGTINSYGVYSAVTADNAGSGTATAVGGYFSATGADNNYGLIVANGNVGIGTTSPDSKLHVNFGASWGEVKLSRDAYVSATLALTTTGGLAEQGLALGSNSYEFFTGSNSRLLIQNNGNVGIGTSSPDRLFHAESSDAVTNAVTYAQRLTHITSGTAAANFGTGMEFELENASGNNKVASVIESTWATATDGAEDGTLIFKTMAGGAAATEAMRIQAGVTTIDNLQLGAMNFPTDGGTLSWVDMPVAAATDNTVESYTAQLDGNPMLTIYGLADGSGGVDNLGVGIGTVTPGQMLSVAGTFGIRESTGATYYTIFQGGDQSADLTYTLPTSSTNGVLTNTAGVLSWAASGGGSGPWTDSGPGTLAYLTALTEDLSVGASSLAAPFSVDVSGNIVRIGDADTTNDAYLNMYGADGDTGTIQYTTNDSWYFSGGKLGIGVANPGAFLDVLGTTEQLRLSYDASKYASFTTGNDSKMTLETSSSTQSMITVGKGTAQDAGISFDGNTNDYYLGMDDATDNLMIGFGQVVGTTPYLTINASGNVGIGTINPNRSLEVYTGDNAASYARITGGEGYSSTLELYADQGDDSADKFDLTSTAGNLLQIRNNASALMTVTADGKVGIGTTSPGADLSVGSSTDRADAEVYGEITAKGYDIQRTLSGIIDIFIYDTARDSDGGEWRNSIVSQQMSWAKETIDSTGSACSITTDDRCGTAVFPRKAIIVTTASALYIFDGADNTLWMKFTQAGTYALGSDTDNNPSGVEAQNGVIAVGTNGSSATGMYAFDFKQDAMYRYDAANRVQSDKNIGNRNTSVTYATNAETTFALVDAHVNDVSIAIQTGSTEGMANTLTLPLDSATSPLRGITLIAAATDAGVSVINMASRRVQSYSKTAGDDYNQVVMTSRGRMYTTNETLAQLEEWRNIDRDVSSELGGTPDRVYDETVGKSPITTGTVPTISTTPGSLAVIERSSSARESAATTLLESGDIVFVGTDQGLAEVHTSGGGLVGASWSKLTTTTVATPYMVGAARAVYLFDEAPGSTTAQSAIGQAGTTNNPMDSANATAPTFGQSGVRGKSVNFNNNSYLCSDANGDGTCDADADFNAAALSFTVSLWFKHSVTPAADVLFEKCYTPATPTAANCVYGGMTSGGNIRFAMDTSAPWTYDSSYDYTVTSTATYADNQWHHAVFTNTDTDMCLYIDGKQAVACLTSIGTTSVDASQVVTIGGSCAGANCITGANFWDGSIDDFVWSSNGGTTQDGLPAQGANKLYLDGRAHLIRPSAEVTNATAFSSTTIGDSGESYVPGSFVGLVVELTGGTGSGQTRTIIANDATTFTVYPAFATTPDATTDYQVSPAKLYGDSNKVTAISADLPTSLNKIRKVYVGTTNGDGGGVSIFTNAGAGSIKTEVIHSDAGYPTDDLGSTWAGTNADNVSAIASYSDTLAYGTGSFLRAQRKDLSIKQLQLDTLGAIEDIRQELVSKQLFGSTQDVLGLGQGADLAEYYNSTESLEAGTIVSMADGAPEMVEKSSNPYQKNVIGIVATKPGMVLGPRDDNSYPVALSGRVPVNVTTENGTILKGDQITASSMPGYGMVAIESGRVIGMALETMDVNNFQDCPVGAGLVPGTKCGQVMAFVNLTDFSGMTMADLMTKKGYDAATQNPEFANSFAAQIKQDVAGKNPDENAVIKSEWTNIFQAANTLGFLRKVNDPAQGATLNSEILAKNINASDSVVSPLMVTDTLIAKNIKAETIEGLEIFETGIQNAQDAADSSVTQVKSLKEQITDLQGTFKALNEKSGGLETGAIKNLMSGGGLIVDGPTEFRGPAIFKAVAEFIDKVIFRNNVEFAGQVMFNQDTAGYALVKEGQDTVTINFEKEYAVPPVVNVSLSLQQIKDAEVRKAAEELLLISDVKFIITNVSEKGFEIRIDQKALSEIPFSWQAIAVKDPKTASEKITADNAGEKTTDIPAEFSAEELPTVSTSDLPLGTGSNISAVDPSEKVLPETVLGTEIVNAK